MMQAVGYDFRQKDEYSLPMLLEYKFYFYSNNM